jgi:hypothetical protein
MVILIDLMSFKFISFEDDINFINVILGGIALFSIAYYYLIKWKSNRKDNGNNKSLAYYRTKKKDIDN